MKKTMSVVSKKDIIKCSLNMVKLKYETMYILFDDLVSIQYLVNERVFLIDDRNYFGGGDLSERIVNVGELIEVNTTSDDPKYIFVFVETIEEVMIYLNDNFKDYTFDELTLTQLTTETVKEMNLKFPGSYETLCSSKPFDNDAYDIHCKEQDHQLVKDNMIVL
jgi:hypothetical protein